MAGDGERKVKEAEELIRRVKEELPPPPVPINGGADEPKPSIDGEEREAEVEQDDRKHIEERLATRYNIPTAVFSALPPSISSPGRCRLHPGEDGRPPGA